jgi:hypothetical protein
MQSHFPYCRRFIFYAVFAFVAPIITHIVAAWKAPRLGWMNYNMDVIHELGRYVTNLNIFNVAVTDAKQVAHQVSATIHHTRKGCVYEGTSACIMAASRFILGSLRTLADKCKAGDFDLFDRFGLDDEMLQSTIIYGHAEKITPLTKEPLITSAFPIVQLSKDLAVLQVQ